jgi:serine/threonine-protein kinase
MADPESTQEVEITIKKACIVCGREYAGEMSICPEDHTPLTALAQENEIGAIIGDRFEIIGLVGKGGMGRVYKARHKMMKRIVAIKMLYSHLVSTASTLKRFQQEAQASSTLSHPNILTVFDFGVTTDGQPYLVMDFLEGTSLGEVLQVEGNLTIERFLHIFTQVAAGLAHAHQRGIIHRDLKPSNIMLVNLDGEPDFVKIVDFGIAKIMGVDPAEAEPLTRTGEVFGSPMYMSPEQCRGLGLDQRTDIYSIGCVMYRALTGLAPFIGRDHLECMFKQVNEEPGHFNEVCPDLFLPDEVESVVFKALAKKPEERYQSMTELKQALESLKSSISQPTTPVSALASAGTGAQETTGKIGSAQDLRSTTIVEANQQNSQKTESKTSDQADSASGQTKPLDSSNKEQNQPLPPISKIPVRLIVGFALGVLGAGLALSMMHKNEPTQPARPSEQAPPAANVAQPPSPEEEKFDKLLVSAQKAVSEGNLDDAERYGLQAMNAGKLLPGGDKKYAASLDLLGRVSYSQGQYDQSATYLQQALRLRQKAFGDKSAEVAATKTSLGRAWSALGQYTKAEVVLNQALDTRKSLFGKDDLVVADTLSALGDVELRQHKYGDAIDELTRALDIREIVNGKESLDAANAMNDLAQAYQLQRSFDKALPLYAQALTIRQKKLSPDNPLIADSYICIGALCEQTGQKDKARALYQSALAIQEKSLAPSSPRIAGTRKRIANLDNRSSKGRGVTKKGFGSWLAK